jgi:hypothetical protein
MTTWQFVKSYLSPVMLFFRICWLGMGGMAALIAYSGASSLPAIGLWAFAAFMAWIALRPWGTTNVSEINKKLDGLNDRFR